MLLNGVHYVSFFVKFTSCKFQYKLPSRVIYRLSKENWKYLITIQESSQLDHRCLLLITHVWSSLALSTRQKQSYKFTCRLRLNNSVLTCTHGLVLQYYLYCVSAENRLNLILLVLLTEFIQKSITCSRTVILKSEI